MQTVLFRAVHVAALFFKLLRTSSAKYTSTLDIKFHTRQYTDLVTNEKNTKGIKRVLHVYSNILVGGFGSVFPCHHTPDIMPAMVNCPRTTTLELQDECDDYPSKKNGIATNDITLVLFLLQLCVWLSITKDWILTGWKCCQSCLRSPGKWGENYFMFAPCPMATNLLQQRRPKRTHSTQIDVALPCDGSHFFVLLLMKRGKSPVTPRLTCYSLPTSSAEDDVSRFQRKPPPPVPYDQTNIH